MHGLAARHEEALTNCSIIHSLKVLVIPTLIMASLISVGIEWSTLHKQTPPKLDAFLPANNPEDRPLHATDAGDDELADIQAAVYMQRNQNLDVCTAEQGGFLTSVLRSLPRLRLGNVRSSLKHRSETTDGTGNVAAAQLMMNLQAQVLQGLRAYYQDRFD